MTAGHQSFSPLQRVLNWLMAVMVLAMLFTGVAMVSTVRPVFLTLVAIHKPLGIAILVLSILRLAVRLRRGAPPLSNDMLPIQATAAKLSHVLLYALMIAMPLIGWGLLSAGGYPVVLFGSVHLPAILAHDDELHAILRTGHTVLAYLFFATILLHFAAAPFPGLIREDGVLRSMTTGRVRRFEESPVSHVVDLEAFSVGAETAGNRGGGIEHRR